MPVDKSLVQKVVIYLKQLGLDAEQTQVYIYLLENGSQTVLAISRGLKTGRTKLYPLLDDLATKQLITVHERHYGTSYEAQSPEVLDFLVSEKERKASTLRSNLNATVHALQAISQISPATSRVAEYRGVDGLKQMNWNLTKAKDTAYVYELANLDVHLGKHFSEKMRRLFVDNKLTIHDLTNNPDWHMQTEVDTLKKYSKARYIDPKVFTIEFETYIYNNCVALLSYDKDDIFGVEIYNDKLARQQKQLFELLWSQAQPLTKLQ